MGDRPDDVADSNDGRKGPSRQGNWAASGSCKREETDFPQEPPEKNTTLSPWFPHREGHFRFLTSRTVRVFKPLSVWYFIIPVI